MIRIFITMLLCVPTLLFSQNTSLNTIPFELKNDNRIYIKCKINETDSLSFLFDTGANGTVINSYILDKKIQLKLNKEADNNGSQGAHKVQISTNNTIQFGSLFKKNIDLLSIDYGADKFDGVFGTNLIEDYIVEIDYDKKELRFYEPKKYVYPKKHSGYTKFKMGTVSDGGLYTIKTAIIMNGKKA